MSVRKIRLRAKRRRDYLRRDPYYRHVTKLLHVDGVMGSSSFVDSLDPPMGKYWRTYPLPKDFDEPGPKIALVGKGNYAKYTANFTAQTSADQTPSTLAVAPKAQTP